MRAVCPDLPETRNLSHNHPAMDFPTLSRKPALKTRESTIDPTLRDSLENGMETSRARFTRRRRQFDVSIEHLTPADKTTLEDFVETDAVFGALSFNFPDNRDPANPVSLNVRFSTIPSYVEAGNEEGVFRQNCTFQIREV